MRALLFGLVGATAVVIATSCISISPPDGTVRCNPAGNACPDGYECSADNFCRRRGSAVDLSSGVVEDGGGGGAVDLTSAGPDLTTPPDMTPLCARIQVTTLSGTGVAGLVNGAGNLAQFNGPRGITVDANGNLFVADAGNKAIRKVLANGVTSTESAPTNAFVIARLVNLFGTLYYVDTTDDGVFRVTSPTASTRHFSLGAMIAVAVAPGSSQFYVTKLCGGVYRYISGTEATLWSGDGSSCAFMDGAAATAKFNQPSDLVFDSNGVIYVADTLNRRIRRVATDGSVTTLAGSTQGHTDGTGAAAQFDAPTGITIDTQQNILYVADNTTIRAVSTTTGAVTTIAGTTSGFVDGDGCVARFGKLDGITFFAGALYAVDINRVRKIQLP
jgi:hypothetical protein